MAIALKNIGLLVGSVFLAVLACEAMLQIAIGPHFLEGDRMSGFG